MNSRHIAQANALVIQKLRDLYLNTPGKGELKWRRLCDQAERELPLVHNTHLQVTQEGGSVELHVYKPSGNTWLCSIQNAPWNEEENKALLELFRIAEPWILRQLLKL